MKPITHNWLYWLLLINPSFLLQNSNYGNGVSATHTAGDGDKVFATFIPKRVGASFMRGRMINTRRQERSQSRQARKETCYDMLGCFPIPRKGSPLKKSPDSPEAIGTTFLLYTRSNKIIPQILLYGDGMDSLQFSNFDPQRPVKMVVHGYKGSIKDPGAVEGINNFLKLVDGNIIMVDWERGAAGPSYPVAVANTELVGRQISLLLLDMLSLGTKPTDIHVVGFSLGAHVAACASHMLMKRGVRLGRITGLDPASPIYRNQLFLEPSRKLDVEDADFVDVVHTDGSLVWTNGFGLLEPLGHIDFFPNGGKEQPGCNDGRASLVVSHFEGTVNSTVVCSHARAWRLFLESLAQHEGGCQFTAYPCMIGRRGFREGKCFPPEQFCNPASSCGKMGINSRNAPGRGLLYLVTRDSYPYCGEQLRATAHVSEITERTRGILHLKLSHGNSSTNFRMNYEYFDVVEGGHSMWGLAAAEFGSIGPKITPTISAQLSYQSLSFQSGTASRDEDNSYIVNPQVFLDKVEVADIAGNKWSYCGKETLLVDKNQTSFDELTITLTLKSCII